MVQLPSPASLSRRRRALERKLSHKQIDVKRSVRWCERTCRHLLADLGALGLLPGQALRLPHGEIALSEPFARLDNLHNVDELLHSHNGEADGSKDPGPEGIHLVRARKLESCRAVRIREDLAQQRCIDLCAGLNLHGLRVGDGVEERGRQKRRGEGQEVEGDEE